MQLLKAISDRLRSNIRHIILSCLIFIVVLQPLVFGGVTAGSCTTAGLGVAYVIALWGTRSSQTMIKKLVVLVILWLLIVVSWIWLYGYPASATLMIFVFGLIVYRLPFRLSLVLSIVIISINSILLYSAELAPTTEIIAYIAVGLGALALMISGRIRKAANEERQRHLQELSQVHQEIEEAHFALQQAHNKLEEAADRSIRYAVLEERTRISREIHDSIGHGLTSVIVQLQALPFRAKQDPEIIQQTIATVLQVTRECLAEVRTVVHEMADHSKGLGLLALKALVVQVEENSNVTINFNAAQSESDWGEELSVLLYRVLQEALTNVMRHANATEVDVSVVEQAGAVTMSVKDNGSFGRSSVSFVPGFGIASMKERCEAAGGALTITGNEPHGLVLTATVPLLGPEAGSVL